MSGSSLLLVRGALGQGVWASRSRLRAALVAGALALTVGGAHARGPEKIADTAEQVIDAVVNISTTQKGPETRSSELPRVPPGSPMEEFFEDFFKNQNRGRQGENQNRDRSPR